LVLFHRETDVLRITKQTDYGLILLGAFTHQPRGAFLSARDVAELSGLSVPMTSKILKNLARAEIVVSHRGAGGGYSLARPAHETSVADVVRALEGPISMVECGAHPGQCEREPNCPVRVNWARINREVGRALERVALTDLFAGHEPLLSLEPPRPAART
jgi:FeS assembly SUF system regulator